VLLSVAPVLLQHLLSWRSSEWMIYFHYGAPLLPLFWIASVQALASLKDWKRLPSLVPSAIPLLLVVAAVVAQMWLGVLSRVGLRNAALVERKPGRRR